MNAIPSSVFLGPLFLAAFFVISAVTVAGCKILFLFFVKERKKMRSSRPPRPKKTDKFASSAVRSIEINPEEVDRIYVKKVS